MKYTVTSIFEESIVIEKDLTFEQAAEFLPTALHGAMRLMMHVGDSFKFESKGEVAGWSVVCTNLAA